MTYLGDYDDDLDEPEPPEEVVCKRCGKTGLYWDDDGGGGWVLMESMYKVHTCKNVSPDVANDFEVIE